MDIYHEKYQTFMENTIVMLEHARRCIERINIEPREGLDHRYGPLRSYNALIGCAARLSELLRALKNHWEKLKSVEGRVLSSDAGPGLYQDLGNIQVQLDSIDHSWKTCVDDIKAETSNSANP